MLILDNFDETLSYYHYLRYGPILVEFNKFGKLLFDTKILNYKPKVDIEAKQKYDETISKYMPELIEIEEDNDDKIFLVANELLINKYISQYFEHAVILGPVDIRDKIKKRLIKMCENYDIKIQK